MAIQISMLILTVCLASAIASIATRDPKELLIVPHLYSPFYHVPSMQSRYGLTQRQTNSPINPMIDQQNLGPFFGYFPNLLTQPCLTCAVCENCTVVPPTPIPATLISLTSCGNDPILSAAPNGTISLNVPIDAMDNPIFCSFGLVAYFSNTKIKVKCSTLGTRVTMKVSPLVTAVSPAVVATEYISKDNFLILSLDNNANPRTIPVVAECSWKTVPA